MERIMTCFYTICIFFFCGKNIAFKQVEDFQKNQQIPKLRVCEDIRCTSKAVIKWVIEILKQHFL